MNELPESAILLIDGHHGVYIPELFADMFPEHTYFEEREILKQGPDNDEYWEVWEDLLNREFIHPEDGRGALYQEDDLWFIPHENL